MFPSSSKSRSDGLLKQHWLHPNYPRILKPLSKTWTLWLSTSLTKISLSLLSRIPIELSRTISMRPSGSYNRTIHIHLDHPAVYDVRSKNMRRIYKKPSYSECVDNFLAVQRYMIQDSYSTRIYACIYISFISFNTYCSIFNFLTKENSCLHSETQVNS